MGVGGGWGGGGGGGGGGGAIRFFLLQGYIFRNKFKKHVYVIYEQPLRYYLTPRCLHGWSPGGNKKEWQKITVCYKFMTSCALNNNIKVYLELNPERFLDSFMDTRTR